VISKGLVILVVAGSACTRAAAPLPNTTPVSAPSAAPGAAPLVDPKGHPWLAKTEANAPTLHQGAAERLLVLERVDGSPLFAEDAFALRLRVSPDRLTVADSCSSATVGYTYTHGGLDAKSLPQLGSTQKACTERSRARVTWLAELLRSGPRVELRAGALAFSGTAGSALFVDEPTYPLVGTPWQIVSCTKTGAAEVCGAWPLGGLTLRADGSFEATLPCATLSGAFSAAEGSVVLSPEGSAPQSCTAVGAKQSSELLTKLLIGDPLIAELQREQLRLSGPSGRVFARAASAPVRTTADFENAPSTPRDLL
jgi:heat shock protein HslJ